MNKNWSRKIRAGGHTCYVSRCSQGDLPAASDSDTADSYSTFYTVRNCDADGTVLPYLAKGHNSAPEQVVAFYRNGAFWTGYRNNIRDALNAAMAEGWKYA